MKLNSMHRPLALLGLIVASALPLSSQAQNQIDSRLDPVNVTANRDIAAPRVDVSQTCPDVAASLRDSLAGMVYRMGDTGEMKVDFQLKGTEIESVSTKGGPMGYRQPVRRAVRELNCVNDGQANQKFSFLVVFKQPNDLNGGDEAVALRDATPQTLAMTLAKSE